MEINFREWILLEMPHMRIRQCPLGGECFVDLHQEKWRIDQGNTLRGDWESFDRNRPWVAPWENGWIVFDGGQDTYFTNEKPEGNFQELPSGWYDYAEIVDERGIQVKKPKFNIEDYLDLTN